MQDSLRRSPSPHFIWQWVASRTRFRSKWNSDVAVLLLLFVFRELRTQKFPLNGTWKASSAVFTRKHHAKITFLLISVAVWLRSPSGRPRRGWYRAHLIDFNVPAASRRCFRKMPQCQGVDDGFDARKSPTLRRREWEIDMPSLGLFIGNLLSDCAISFDG